MQRNIAANLKESLSFKNKRKSFKEALLNSYSKWVLQVLTKTLFINKRMEGRNSSQKEKKILKCC